MTEPPAETAVVEEVAPAPVEDPYRCYRCSSPHDPFQEYCLECGARLAPIASGGAWRRDAWTRDSPLWFWATLLALLLIALVTGAIVLAATGDDDGRRTASTGRASLGTSQLGPPATPPPTQAPTTTTPAFPTDTTTPVPTLPQTPPPFPTTTAPTTTGPTTTAPTTTGTTTGTGTVIGWPEDEVGYTIILRSVPKSQARSVAEAEARNAIADGLQQVGVLDSDRYTSLEAGYWTVFYGIHDTESQASTNLSKARTAGYTSPYIRHVQE